MRAALAPLAAFSLFAAPFSASLAQPSVSGEGTVAADRSATPSAVAPVAASALYRLELNSTYEQGCFPPCLCPVFFQGRPAGTLRLVPATGPDPAYRYFTVSEVNWKIPHSGLPSGEWLRATGFGTFRIQRPSANALPPFQQLTLTLVFDNAAATVFDSGVVRAGALFPNIDASISIHGGVCNDTVIRVAASPVPASDVRPFTLQGARYTEGCLPPCTCPTATAAALGGFSFVALPATNANPATDYAVVNANWSIVPLNSSPAVPPGANATLARGYGIYTVVAGVAGAPPRQRLTMDFAFLPMAAPTPTPPAAVLRRFDSGLAPFTNAAGFAPLNIDIAENGFACFDRVFQVRSAPARPLPGPASAAAD